MPERCPDIMRRALFITTSAAWRRNKMLLAEAKEVNTLAAIVVATEQRARWESRFHPPNVDCAKPVLEPADTWLTYNRQTGYDWQWTSLVTNQRHKAPAPGYSPRKCLSPVKRTGSCSAKPEIPWYVKVTCSRNNLLCVTPLA